MRNYRKYILPAAVMAAAVMAPSAARAITVTIDGVSSPTLLSDAVDTCMTAGAGPHTINITTDTITLDRQVFINQAITINGDANNNNIPCDILVDVTSIKAASDVGVQNWKSYIEVQAPAVVNVNNLNIHPNENGGFAGTSGSPAGNISGIRFFNPVQSTDTGTYNFTKVAVSGSDGSNAFIDPATGSDAYSVSGAKRWAGFNGAQEQFQVLQGAIQFSDDVAGGAGTVIATLDNCKAAISRGTAINVEGAKTTVNILGGVYGHVQRDAIRYDDGASGKIQGTLTNRVRVIRSTLTSGGNSHGIEVTGNANLSLIEYVDVASVQSANLFSLRDAKITEINGVRALGKIIDPNYVAPFNQTLYINTATNDIDLIRNSTFVGTYGNPMAITSSVVNPIEFRDCIFTGSSTTATIELNSTTAGVATYNNCGIPTDGLAGESLAATPFSGAGTPVVNAAVSASPQYMLTLADYDWSDAQGSGNPLNGAGNRNVLRPALTNPAYLTASSTGGRLTGGAGPDAAGITDWMMME